MTSTRRAWSSAPGSSTSAKPATQWSSPPTITPSGADELIFLDMTATSDKRGTVVELAGRTADEVFVPFTIGGGLLEVTDAQAVLDAGADKLSVTRPRWRVRSW